MSTNAETTATPEQATTTTTKARRTGGNRGKHDEIMSYVESELKSNKEITNPDLFEKAREKFPTLKRGWDSRKFNGTFNLPSKRRLGMIGGRKPGRPARATMPARARVTPRVNVRSEKSARMQNLLIEFAKAARGASSIDDLFSTVDSYADRALSI